MSNYEFGGSLYRTQRSMLDAMAHEWLLHADSVEEAREILAEENDADLAAQCINELKLDEAEDGWPGDDDLQSHMAEHDYSEHDLEDAFARLRERLVNGEEAA